jgi:hypothetical protein
MRTLAVLLRTIVVICAASVSLCAAAYHGVDVGQRDDFMPPEFTQVARGEYRAQFGNELMQVFTEGALVTGFKVIPLAPMTLAEAIAAHSPGAPANNLQLLLDFNRRPIGVADVPNRIAYFTHSTSPEAAVRVIGHYNEITDVQVLTTPLPNDEAQTLAAAAARSSARAVNRRPRTNGLYEQAEYLVEADSEIAQRQGKEAFDELALYKRACSATSTNCEQAGAAQKANVIQAASLFFKDVTQAERTYNANAGLLGNPPEELIEVQGMADSLLQQVRAALGPVQFESRP